MSTYANINGVKKQLKPIYQNLSGVSKQIEFIYSNIDGVQKTVYDSRYCWAKYTSQRTSTKYWEDPVAYAQNSSITMWNSGWVETEGFIRIGDGDEQVYITYGTGYSFNSSTNKLSLTGICTIQHNSTFGFSNYSASELVGKYIIVGGTVYHIDSANSYNVHTDCYYASGSAQYLWKYVFQEYVYSSTPNAYTSSSISSYYAQAGTQSRIAYVSVTI